MATNIWTASSPGNASVDGNWSLGHAPTTGEDVLFCSVAGGGSVQNCTWNIASATAIPNSWTVGGTTSGNYSGTITLSASITVGVGAGGVLLETGTTGTITGVASTTMQCAGSFIKNAGTVTSSYLNLTMTGNGNTVTCSNTLLSLTVNGNTYINSGYTYNLTVASNQTLTVNTGQTFVLRAYSATYTTFSNSGTIASAGTGIFGIMCVSSTPNPVFTFGTITAALNVYADSTTAGNITAKLAGNTVLSGTLTVSSLHATYTCTLSHNSNYTLTVAGLTTLGTRGLMTQGTGVWAFNGGYAQSGASSVFTQGAAVVNIIGTTTISAGTVNGNTSNNFNVYGNFIHTGGTIAADTFCLNMTKMDSTLTSSAQFKKITLSAGNVNITNNLTIASGDSFLPQTNKFYLSANFNPSAGTFTQSTSQAVILAASTVTFGAGQKFYDLIIHGPYLTLGSNITVDNILAYSGPINKASYSITMTHPEREYTGFRRPIAKSLSRPRGLSPALRPLLENLERLS